MEGDYEPHPAIVRPYSSTDRDAEVLHTPSDTVTFSRGWGDSGKRVQVVDHECPECSFDRMVRRVKVTPVERDSVQYWCLNPNCVHFVRDHLSHACKGNYPHRDTTAPAVVEGDE